VARELILALAPGDLAKDAIEGKIFEASLLYWRELEIEPYPIICECSGGQDATGDGWDVAERKIGKIREFLRLYESLPTDKRPIWRDYIFDWVSTVLEASKLSEYYQDPDPNCEVCHGKGINAEFTHIPGGIFDYIRIDPKSLWHTFELPENIADIKCSSIFTLDRKWFAATPKWDYDDPEWQKTARQIILDSGDCWAIRCMIHV
jgi:hypothetical protein